MVGVTIYIHGLNIRENEGSHKTQTIEKKKSIKMNILNKTTKWLKFSSSGNVSKLFLSTGL